MSFPLGSMVFTLAASGDGLQSLLCALRGMKLSKSFEDTLCSPDFV